MRPPLTLPPDTGMGRLEWRYGPPAAVYYIAHEGSRWRVHDCVFEQGRLRRIELEHASATVRVFVADTGVRKLYRRRPRENWTITPARCERQLAEAEYLGQLPDFDAAARTAR